MKKMYKFLTFNILCILYFGATSLSAQITLKGKVLDTESGEDLIGAAIAVISGGTGGAVTNYEGEFSLKVDVLPATLRISYTGYATQEVNVSTAERITIKLSTSSIIIAEAVVRGQRIDDKQKAAPLTVENLDAIAIRETAAVSFYNGLGNLKGVDLTTASLGFTVINMRGFNSTSPVRSLQIIDGVDNQAPGLNFSLGNFLGCSELDVNKVDLVVGASSAFYGPNAFNGVISMESKNPFVHRGLSVSLKTGERNLLEGAFRYGDAIKNKAGHPVFAYKLNLFALRANDWVADNYDPITEAEGNQVFATAGQNPGGWNAVNIYGDEYSGRFVSTYDARAGLNSFHRQGYKEVDVVDYDTKNLKAGVALHFRLNPSKEFDSPELIVASNYGTGTTVYQGDNRFSLRGIQFYQNRIELRQKDKFFVRLYSTNEDAGRSYDPYFTSLKMLEASKTNEQWQQAYEFWWVRNDLGAVFNKMKAAGYGPPDNFNALLQWQRDNSATLADYHQQAQAYANQQNPSSTLPFFEPGTPRYDSLFNAIVSRKNNSRENGTLFYDKSALYHAHGEYRFKPKFLNEWVVGANTRLYRPVSDGTIFNDSLDIRIKNSEFGIYTGADKQVGNFKFSATVRVDKNQNFDYLATPATSIVWTPRENNYLRLSFSSAIRNPTLTDQYLNLRVGPATLIGNLNGFDSLITLESFRDYRDDNSIPLVYQNIAPIRPEKVKTFELGYRTTLFNRVYMDAGYYYNIYNDFIGYNIGLTLPFERVEVFPGVYTFFPDFDKLQVFRVASNASQRVTSQGIAIGLNYYFLNYFMVQGNYSWNKLNTAETDPIVPAFNTPEHKYNLGFSGRDIKTWGRNTLGFNINYKWIDNFTFEGSPQFTGIIPSYELLDAQVNMNFPKIHSTIKLGASNLLNNKQFQTYGGPRIGRMAYLSLVYDFREK